MHQHPQVFPALTAGDLMKQPVVVIPLNMSLRAAAHILQREQISGAPVVNATGRCVGVLSTTDFLKWVDDGGSGQTPAQPLLEVCSEAQVIDLELLPRDEVCFHMSTNVVSCGPDLSVTRLARQMLDAHIHRVVVVDFNQRPVGVVTSTDILAAVARMETAPEAVHA